MRINELTTIDEVQAADKVLIHSLQNGDARLATLTTLAALLSTLLTNADDKVTEYFAPAATGFTATLTNNGASKFVVLTPTGAFAAGTIALPAASEALDKQEVLVATTQAVTALTLTSTGATFVGQPTTLAAGAFFRLRFDDVLNIWFRVG